MIHIIPYKRLAACNLDELGAQQALNNRRAAAGGIAFARKEGTEEKDKARQQILDLLALDRRPGPVKTLTMPGLSWFFEAQLLKLRDPHWRTKQAIPLLDLHCVENDRFVYYSAATKMPGNKGTMIRQLERPPYAEQAIGNGIVKRYIFANVDDLMTDPSEVFDFVWLDYTGPLSLYRMKRIGEFWRNQVRETLVVTSLRARWNKETSRAVERAGGLMAWQRTRLPGHVLHEIEYQDGHAPMAQYAVSKDQPLFGS